VWRRPKRCGNFCIAPAETGRRPRASAQPGFGETVGHVAFLKRGNHFIEVAFDDAVEIVEGEADAVVGQAILREVVSADFFLAPGTADEAAPVSGVFRLFFFAFVFEEAGAEDFEGGGFVFLLRAAVLAADDFSGGEVKDLDGGVGGVDALPAGASGAADFDAEILRSEFDVDFLGLGEHGHGGGGGVDAALGFGGGDALHAVDSALVAQAAEDGVAGDLEDDFFEASESGGAGVHRFNSEPLGFRVALIHPVEVGGEERGLVAAGAGADLDDGVAVLGFVGREEGELDVAVEDGQTALDLRDLGGGKFRHFRVGAVGQFLIFGELRAEAAGFVVGLGEFFQPGLFTHDVACLGGVRIKVVGGHEPVQFGQTLAFFGDERGEIHETKNGDRPRGGAITVSATSRLSFFETGGFDRAVATREFLHASGGIDELLFAGEEGMAGCADADLDVLARGTGVVDGPAGAGDRRFSVIRMETSFHGRGPRIMRESERLARPSGGFARQPGREGAKLRPVEHTGKWFLKKHEDSEVFGPVDFTKLKEWARAAQISPLDMVSDDRANWIKAPMLQELHMDYLIQLGEDSYYGPTTEEAVQEFLRLGEIHADTVLINCCTGAETALRESGFFQGQPPPMEDIAQAEPGRRTIRHNLQQRIRELELLLVEKRQQLEMAEVRIRQLEKRLHGAGLRAE
jgi:hypothetical protein